MSQRVEARSGVPIVARAFHALDRRAEGAGLSLRVLDIRLGCEAMRKETRQAVL